MPQYNKSPKLCDANNNSRRCGRKIAAGKVLNATLDSSGGINNRCFVIVSLTDGVKIDFPVPTTQEIRDRFFYKKAKTQPDKPARPPNKFFIFRTMFQGAIDKFKLQVPIVSGLASEVWKKSSPEVVELFTKLSQIAKTEHGEINPGYVYKPNRKSRNTKEETSHVPSPTLDDLSSLPSYSPTALPFWTEASKANLFENQEHENTILSSHSDDNLYATNDLIATAQAFSSYNNYYLTTLFPYQQICNQYSANDIYYTNNELSQDVDALVSPPQPPQRNPYQHPMPYFPTTNTNLNDDIFGSPISESGDVSIHTTPFSVDQTQHPSCMYFY